MRLSEIENLTSCPVEDASGPGIKLEISKVAGSYSLVLAVNIHVYSSPQVAKIPSGAFLFVLPPPLEDL